MSKVSRTNTLPSDRAGADGTVRPMPKAALKRRETDLNPPAPTIDSVRDLLLGDAIKQSRRDIEAVERQTHNQLGGLRVELGDRIDRVVRALSTVNQAVNKELGAREEAVRQSADEITTRMEDRLGLLEAKIHTVVAETERKVAASQAADSDKLVAKLAEVTAANEAKVAALTKKFEERLVAFGSQITKEISNLNDKLVAVREQTGNELESAGTKMGEQLGAAEQRLKGELGELRDELDTSSATMRREMKQRASEQLASIAKSEAHTQAILRDHLDALEGRKVSRTDFSTLLHEIAARLDAPQVAVVERSSASSAGDDKQAE